jgi:hypothetical protein
MDEWNKVLETALEFRLSGLLIDRLPAGSIPDLVRAQLERTRRGIQHRNLYLWLALEEWLERFQAAGIAVVVLKGAALTKLVYGSLGWRPMTDIDFLVERDDFLRAGQRLTVAGLVRAVDVDGNDQVPRTQAMFCTSHAYPIFIDLHWHLLDSNYYARRVPIRWFWEHTIVLNQDKPAMRVLSPEAQLLHLVAHLELHHAGASLLSLYDVAALVDRFGNSMNWDLVVDAATRFEWRQSLRCAMQRAQQVFGIAVPEPVNASLSHLRGTYRERLARTLATPEAHPAAFIFDGWDQDGWCQRLSYWKTSLFPSKAFMRVRNHECGAASKLHYMQRLARGLTRVPGALAAGAMIFWRSGGNRTGSAMRVRPLCRLFHAST